MATADLRDVFSDLERVYARLAAAVDRRMRRGCGLSLVLFEPMVVIAETGSCRVHDLAVALGLSAGGASKLVDRLEAAGYCRRLPNPGDRRSSLTQRACWTRNWKGYWGSRCPQISSGTWLAPCGRCDPAGARACLVYPGPGDVADGTAAAGLGSRAGRAALPARGAALGPARQAGWRSYTRQRRHPWHGVLASGESARLEDAYMMQ
jgi:MarR family